MKVGEYVRTRDGEIFKLNNIIYQDDNYIQYQLGGRLEDKDFLKSSPNIIDLIEVGDYVNEIRVTNISKEQGKNIEIYLDTDDLFEQTIYKNEDIKSIVTHEQFSQMEYRIGE